MRMLVALLAVVTLLGACDGARTTLEEQLGTSVEDLRGRADELLARGQDVATTFEWCTGAAQLAQAVVAGDVEQARAEAEVLRAEAPADLAGDLRTIAEAAARAQVGDPRGLLEQEVQDAARDVYAYAIDLCGVPGGEG